MTRRNSRLPFRRFAFLLATGVVLNALVAWGCAAWAPAPFGCVRDDVIANEFPDLELRGNRVESWRWHTGTGWRVAEPRGAFSRSGYNSGWRGKDRPIYRWAGWPFLGLRSTTRFVQNKVPPFLPRRWSLPPLEIIRRGLQTDALPEWMHAQPRRRLPLVPDGLAFVGNVVFYAVACALVLHVAGCVRATWRDRCGRCVGCRYDLTGLSDETRCPECGWPRGAATMTARPKRHPRSVTAATHDACTT